MLKISAFISEGSKNEKGFTYIMVLLTVVIIGISLSAVGRYWHFIDQREKEEELLFRGDQFVQAIDAFFINNGNSYPKSLDELLKDTKSLTPKRYLRRIYEDPMTGKADWAPIIKEKSKGQISGVKSRSRKTPIREAGFPEKYKEFAGRGRYSEWEFVHKPLKEDETPPLTQQKLPDKNLMPGLTD